MIMSSATYSTLSQHILPGVFANNSVLRKAVLVLAGSLFIAVMAQLSFRFPASPIPITGQTFAVLIVGMALGSRLGALAAIAYCLEGMYFPVFAEMRTWAHPFTLYTAGYLFGFVGAAYVTGWLAERGWDRNDVGTGLAMLAGNLVLYVPGLIWLNVMMAPASFGVVVTAGFGVFIIGDLLKLVLAMIIFPTVWRMINR
jgi:biotin transport system substrate-specific component